MNEPMTPQDSFEDDSHAPSFGSYADSYADSYATHYGALDDVGTPPELNQSLAGERPQSLLTPSTNPSMDYGASHPSMDYGSSHPSIDYGSSNPSLDYGNPSLDFTGVGGGAPSMDLGKPSLDYNAHDAGKPSMASSYGKPSFDVYGGHPSMDQSFASQNLDFSMGGKPSMDDYSHSIGDGNNNSMYSYTSALSPRATNDHFGESVSFAGSTVMGGGVGDEDHRITMATDRSSLSQHQHQHENERVSFQDPVEQHVVHHEIHVHSHQSSSQEEDNDDVDELPARASTPKYSQQNSLQNAPPLMHSPSSRKSKLSNLSRTFVSQKSVSRESVRELAKTALSVRAVSMGEVTFENPNEANLRESIRRVHAYSRRDAPVEYELTASAKYKNRECEIRLDTETVVWSRRAKLLGKLLTDDIVGAEAPMQKPGLIRIHYFQKGRGTGAKALRRKHGTVDFTCEPLVAEQWIHAIQELVRWQARAPPMEERRRIKVVVNPHSGKQRARKIWLEQVKRFFDLGEFDYVVEETTYGGHAIDMGKSYSPEDGFEALIFIGGDGTLCEFMNGLLTRPEKEWREIVATTPISLISAGTQNAFGIGVGIPTIEAAVYCIIKRKMRPLDVITTVSEGNAKVEYSYCGVGWGVAGDIAAESEKYRWLGTSRYAFLKLKRTVVAPKKHTGLIRYVPTEPAPPLCKYDDIRDEGAMDQFDVEEGNVYDMDRNSTLRKSWIGTSAGIKSPASSKRYPEALWKEERGRFLVVGVVNTAPDGAFAHPSDGNLDLIITRRGNIFKTIKLAVLYLFGKELKSSLISYIKVKAVKIEPDQLSDCMNMDGEVLANGPWRIEVVPSLFKALSEK